MVIREQRVQLADGTLKTIYVKHFVPGEEEEIVEAVQQALAKKGQKAQEAEPVAILSSESDMVLPDPTDLE